MTLILGLILGAGFVVFALQNTQMVMVTFLGWGFEGSVAIIVIAALLAGIIISLLMSIPGAIRGMMNESNLRGNNAALRRELDDHKEKLDDAHRTIAEIKQAPDQIIVTKL
jgi:uncharacterized integral membrane protein